MWVQLYSILCIVIEIIGAVREFVEQRDAQVQLVRRHGQLMRRHAVVEAEAEVVRRVKYAYG